MNGKGKGGRPRDPVWSEFHESQAKRQRSCVCVWCHLEMKSEPKRMLQHLAQKCKSIDEATKQKYQSRWMETSSSSISSASVHGSDLLNTILPSRKLIKGAAPKRKILIAGGGFNTVFIKYMASLTGKDRPRICFLPTASADRDTVCMKFYESCATLNVEPHVQRSFINSSTQNLGWDDVLLSMDAIVCSGGNTLNQQAIWRAQGIDVILREAWERGIVLGGASAGGLCWFDEGTTDSRPKELSIVKCLGFLPGSHCPHYDVEPGRRPLYQKLIATGELKPGYACDNDAGIYFEDTKVSKVVRARENAKVYYVALVHGAIQERELTSESIDMPTPVS
jgi:dipeptidase E